MSAKHMHIGLVAVISTVIAIVVIQTSDFNNSCEISNDYPTRAFNYSADKMTKSGQEFSTTIVTGLYDIKRQDRSFEEYKHWFRRTLKIPIPMIVFCKSENVAWIRKARGSREIVIVEEESIPLEHLVNKISEILPSMRQGRPDVEWVNKRYIATQYSKAIWLKRGIQCNPYNSHFFFWVDAGVSRFFTGGQPKTPLPLLQNTNLLPDKLYISSTKFLPLVKLMTENIIVGSQIPFVMGTVFGGRITTVNRMCDAMLDILYKTMLNKCRVDNEQVAFGLIFKEHPDWFELLDQSHCNVACL